MVLDLYFIAKTSTANKNLSYWTSENSSDCIEDSLSFNLDKFKFKNSTDHIFSELSKELTYHLKETDYVKRLFSEFNGSKVNIQLIDSFHHAFLYDDQKSTLMFDSRIELKFVPVYLFAIYFAFARETYSANQIYNKLFDFLLAFDFRVIKALYEYFKTDSQNLKSFDPGDYFLNYIELIYKIKTGETKTYSVNDFEKFRKTQLLRNRSLAGKLPYDLVSFEELLDDTDPAKDLFSEEINQKLFDVMKESFDVDYGKLYYKNLTESLKAIGLKIVAQRGSRVAHEQGPILVNAQELTFVESFQIQIKKIKSHIEENLFKLKDNLESLEFEFDFSAQSTQITIQLDSLVYLSELTLVQEARFKKDLLLFQKYLSELYFDLKKELRESLSLGLVQNSNKIDSMFALINQHELFVEESFLSLMNTLLQSKSSIKNAVIYVQRVSSRSGHFLPRIVLGQKLYVETDKQSEDNRLDAIPFNFVSPDLDLIAGGIDSFFENASISIVTDRDTGKPEIKWDNAEDLAKTLAPSLYKAIESSYSLFHYQLETTLLGPLIDLFKVILENEISNIASIANYVKTLGPGKTVEDVLFKYQNAYALEITKAAEYVIKFYLLENRVEEIILIEKLSRQEAILELLKSLRDVQQDTFALLLNSKKDKDLFNLVAKLLEGNSSPELKLKEFRSLVTVDLNKVLLKKEIKDKLFYPSSTAIKEFFIDNPNIQKLQVTSNKNIQDADFYYNFSVAPSRIDFGKHVVASITTLMGRMIGADDDDALKVAKSYVDFVSQSPNSIFSSASEAGSVKVIENTCRAIQYAKAISFQGAFQSFAVDGMLARQTVNSRNTKNAGIHIMEFGTMASTGYCITKEPLFILLGLSLNSDSVFDKLGIDDEKIKSQFKQFFIDLIASKSNFETTYEWEIHAYEEIASSALIQAYLADPQYKILPRPDALFALMKFLAHESKDAEMSHLYNTLSSKLIEFSRMINETGIIQRIQLLNNLVSSSGRSYKDLKILMNASYKGNVSDERENANQYMIALLLHKKDFLKNSSVEDIATLIDYQIKNHDLPKEIKIFDPYVDEDVFMGGELKNIAQNLVAKIASLNLKKPLSQEVIEACIISYGSDVNEWQILSDRLRLEDNPGLILSELSKLRSNLKFAELYYKGFYKKAQQAFQNLDVAFLNSDHDEQRALMNDLVNLKELMLVNNPGSMLTLVDNLQQAKKPFLDQDLSMEWIALGGKVLSHMIAPELYQKWRNNIKSETQFAKLYIQMLILEVNYTKDELNDSDEYQSLKASVNDYFVKLKKFSDLYRDVCLQKFIEAKEIEVPQRILSRYVHKLKSLANVSNYDEAKSITFVDWLCFGGRWVLNGKSKQEIDYIIKVFNDSSIKVGKLGYEVLEIFVKSNDSLNIERRLRLIENAGSTKEADLLVTNAADSLSQRSQLQNTYLLASLRFQNLFKFEEKYQKQSFENLSSTWDQTVQDLMTLIRNSKNDLNSLKEINLKFSQLLKITEFYSGHFVKFCPSVKDKTRMFITQRAFEEKSIQEFFGDHKKSQGVFKEIAENIVRSQDGLTDSQTNEELDNLVRFAEMLYLNYLLFLTIDITDENEMINKLAVFFDQYLNVHEEDYPPYMFHSLCAGSAFGFDQTYFYDTNLRVKMFKLSCKSGIYLYKHLHYLISSRTVLKKTSPEYKDALIGDYENGLMPICYQHETICIEERLWDCVRALRNFVRNFHDRHPLPVVIKSDDATVEKLFKYNLDESTELVWIAGISNPGKHSWDLNCVLRSPQLRKTYVNSSVKYSNISVFTPYLTSKGEIKQIYTSFAPEALKNIELLYPFKDDENKFELNHYGFVHAVVDLNGELPKPDITMSAHTHEQYISNFIAELGVPEVWSSLSMKQMYAKTELSKILAKVDVSSLAQVEFLQKEFDNISEVQTTLEKRLANKKLDHIDFWIVKASRDSGGRGISGKFHIKKDRDKIVDFIFEKTKTDDVVMQEFVPNNARSFINSDFHRKISSTFIEAGISIDTITPYEQLYFAMRSFQSFSGIKGYLFSVNIGSVTVNAGQGAKLFYGEPIRIMPIYIAGKIQKLLDEEGDKILKEAIPEHAKEFARENNLKIFENIIGSNNCFMLNGLFDYIPYVFVIRKDKDGELREFKVSADDNSYGGLDFHYNYFGEKVMLITAKNQEDSVLALEDLLKDSANEEWQGPEEKIDINLAKIELNSGLGQANLLQKTIEESAPDEKDLFLEWTEDLGTVAIAAKMARNHGV
jgi:hypothetical protein